MIIKKEYKAYMAHRNQELIGTKCVQPHGHDYKFFCYFKVIRNGNITTLFDDFDSKIEPMLKNEYDHRMLIDINDPLYKSLKKHEEETGECLGMKVLPYPTSVENLCYHLFSEIKNFGFQLEKIEVQETRSSTIIYTESDYENDKKHF